MILLYERTPEQQRQLLKACIARPEIRKKYFESDFYAFTLYYFLQEFKTGITDFHKDIFKMCVSGKNSLVIGFRGCGKTAIVGLFYIIWCIAYKKEEFILFLAYDMESAKDKVLNVANFLRANERFKGDFGNLFDDGGNGRKKRDTFNAQKAMGKFVTTNGVKVEAVSLKNMKRGKQFLNADGQLLRPSLLIADDIDIDESVRNTRIISENEAKIQDGVLKSINGKAFFLGNVITEDGVIQRLEKTYEGHRNTARIALIESGEITWKEKYVWTQKEADERNAEKYGGKKVVQSIETLRIDEQSFQSGYLNNPKVSVGEYVFPHDIIQNIQPKQPQYTYTLHVNDTQATVYIYDPTYFKGKETSLFAGVDTGGGGGGESDATSLCFLNENGGLFASLHSNALNYKDTGDILILLRREYGFLYFPRSLGIERNYLGVALIDYLREKDSFSYYDMYIPHKRGQVRNRRDANIGWITTQSTKEKMITDLREAIHQTTFEMYEEEKKEFLYWVVTRKNDRITYEPDQRHTQHDDRIISRGIAYQMYVTYKAK